MRFPFFRNRDSVKNGILISIRRTGDGFHPGLFKWIVRFIESRIKDPNIIRLVRRTLKAGIMNNYEFEATEEGSGQGSVCSPIISCIYMHYVLVWWFKEVVTPMLKG